jgi:hypothetical protein
LRNPGWTVSRTGGAVSQTGDAASVDALGDVRVLSKRVAGE